MLDGFLKTRDTEDCSNAVMAAEYSALPGQENFTFYNILKRKQLFHNITVTVFSANECKLGECKMLLSKTIKSIRQNIDFVIISNFLELVSNSIIALCSPVYTSHVVRQ